MTAPGPALPAAGRAARALAAAVAVARDHGIAAAVAVARDHGIAATDPVVLHDGMNAVVHLRPAPVVARVATLTPLLRDGDRPSAARWRWPPR